MYRRGRGVMEKCNYCLQRITRARHAADREDRQIGEGKVVTACQAACPTRAIHFGDLNRKDCVSAVPGTTTLHTSRRAQHAPAYHLPEAPLCRRRRVRMSVAADVERRWVGDNIKSLEQIDAIIAASILVPQHSWRWWATLAVSGALTLVMIGTVTWLFGHGIGIFGNNTTIVWGFPIANYVWWLGIGPCGHADLGIAAADLPEMAGLAQPLRRNDDSVRGFDGGIVSDLPPRPPLLCLLDHSLSKRAGAVAAMAQRARLGFLGGRDLHHFLGAVLVCRPDA